jgi:predicted transcriptional regulator
MSTITIRIDDELKARVAAAAERAGKSVQAFVLDLVEHNVEQAEFDAEFHRRADERWAMLLKNGKPVSLPDATKWVEAWTRDRRAGEAAARKRVR